MTIRCVYHGYEPTFPATDQHPQAVRYGPIKWKDQTLWIDAIGGKPTEAEIEKHFAPPPPLTAEAKLSALGLTKADLRALLG